MEEDSQAASIYGETWWMMSPRTVCNNSSDTADIQKLEHFWSKDLMNMKSKSSDECSDDSIIFQDNQLVTPIDWNQISLLSTGVQEEMNTFSTRADDCFIPEFEAEHQDFTVNQQQSLDFASSSNDYITFPISSTSSSYTSTLLQSFFNTHSTPQSPPLPQSPPPLHDFQSNSNTLNFVQTMPKRQLPCCFHLNNDDNIPSFFSTLSSRFLPSSCKEHYHQEILDMGSIAKHNDGDELPFKRPRLETPSPLPTFKVRKEKLGDRITALQQLVSPFGKTDTASVLHEAIEYIKHLHDQVNILGAPYIEADSNQPQQIHEVKHGHKKDLKSRGLCLVPISSMFPASCNYDPS